MEIISGRIHDIRPSGMMIIVAQLPEWKQINNSSNVVEIGIPDGRLISPDQRKRIYAMLRDIADWIGEQDPDVVKNLMKLKFMAEEMDAIARRMFSLSDCDMTTAREFITFLISFIVTNSIPVRQPLMQDTDDIDDIRRYVYQCLMHKGCAVCGGRAELHHVEAIGAGRNRLEINQIGMPVLPLCRKHHTESHQLGQDSFLKKYHLEPIPLTSKIGKLYGLTLANIGQGGGKG
ncbi:MAG: hypothetical protein IJV46_06945 [Acidaminococcaceae bacterium]|nr:hypothetical protein [Acidaminococcaceae bacterium]